ncbi:MAG TPA: hypothetical protein VLM79_01060 [Kofleriaceae bacterium]|nr:hypothetical protein [Kofleriaceae bacterium]
MNIALRALHEVLVAARNMALANPSTPALLSVVDSIEAIPIWMTDPIIDRAEDIIRAFEDLAAEYPECAIAASTAMRLRD